MKNTIKDVFLSRGYTEIQETEEEDEIDNGDWDFLWASRSWIHSHMIGPDAISLRPNQRVNHFPNSGELTQKDLMSKNLMRLSMIMRKNGSEASIDFYPQTFVLPGDTLRFRDCYKRTGGTWICKPSGGSMGQGIRFINSEADAARFDSYLNKKLNAAETFEDRIKLNHVVQRYISNPLLLGGRKFDIRLYSLVLSFNPLIFYTFRGGFCRLTSRPYTIDDFANREVHLTNVAVQTQSDAYDARSGGKWDTQSLRQYIKHLHGYERTDQVFSMIQNIMNTSLLSVESHVISDRHCYELYGYDILIDSDLRPWLIEINSSPSLDANTEDDYDMKFSMLNEMLDLVQLYQKEGASGLPLRYGGFDLIWNGSAVVHRAESTVNCYIGCNYVINCSPNNPFRTRSKFHVKKIKQKTKEEAAPDS